MENSEIKIFKTENGITSIEVKLENETVWLSQKQMAELFEKDTDTIGLHLKNIYETEELNEISTTEKYSVVRQEGKRKVNRKINFYNLDAIISVGYRVNSKRGVTFRKWATQILKEYLIKGYSINQNLIKTNINRIKELETEVNNLHDAILENQTRITDGFLSIISHYSKSFELLNAYDTDELNLDNLNRDIIYTINYQEVKSAIKKFKINLIDKGEASELFGNEKDNSFEGILGSVSQTVFGELAYPTIEEQATQLLYSIIKGHAFSDGNKRIGSFIFVWFLEQNNIHLTSKGERKINDNTLVALALAVAQSIPDQRDIILKLIVNLIKG